MSIRILLVSLSILLFEGVSTYGIAQKKQSEVLNHKVTFDLELLENLNSALRETNISITPDGKHIFFMSDRGGQNWSEKSGKYKGKSRYDGDLWYSNRTPNGWQDPVCMDSTVNTNSGEDEPMISPDGQYVVFQSWKDDWKQTGGPYYVAELSGNKWSNPVGMGGGINKFFIGKYNRSRVGYATDGATLSPDGNIFMVASAEDYDGEMDLYLSKKSNGVWGAMRKMSLSTEGDERSIFMAGDGKTIYFASDGYEGFGGLDVYKTIRNEDGTFGEVMNIGEPFNTKMDDYGFSIAATGEEGFFVRNGDIYSVSITEADANLKPMPVLLISGKIKRTNGSFIETHLNLINTKKKKIVSTSKSNSKTGNYSFSIPQQTATYQIKDRDGVHVDTTFSVKYSDAYQEMNINLKVNEIPNVENESNEQPKEQIWRIVTNFEFNTSNLSTKDKAALDAGIDIMLTATAYDVQISGHTDAKGTTIYNAVLAQKRAEVLKKYLVLKGINEERITIDSHGENQPLSDNTTEKGRYVNRRGEVIIRYY